MLEQRIERAVRRYKRQPSPRRNAQIAIAVRDLLAAQGGRP